MYVHGIALGGFRSFGEQPQIIAPLEKVTLIAGQNNSGKSNILRFVHSYLPDVVSSVRSGGNKVPTFEAMDRHRPKAAPFRFGLALPLTAGSYRETIATRFPCLTIGAS